MIMSDQSKVIIAIHYHYNHFMTLSLCYDNIANMVWMWQIECFLSSYSYRASLTDSVASNSLEARLKAYMYAINPSYSYVAFMYIL